MQRSGSLILFHVPVLDFCDGSSAAAAEGGGGLFVYLVPHDKMFHFEGDAMINLLYYGRLWRDMGLDRLILVHYCANYSKYNFIERRWGM